MSSSWAPVLGQPVQHRVARDRVSRSSSPGSASSSSAVPQAAFGGRQYHACSRGLQAQPATAQSVRPARGLLLQRSSDNHPSEAAPATPAAPAALRQARRACSRASARQGRRGSLEAACPVPARGCRRPLSEGAGLRGAPRAQLGQCEGGLGGPAAAPSRGSAMNPAAAAVPMS